MDDKRRYWEPEIETMPLRKLNELQGNRLRELVAVAYEKTSLYRRNFDEAGIKPSDINTIDDITKLPITDDVADVRNRPLFDRLTIPETEIERFNSTSGTTTGSPEPIPFNKKDTDTLLDGEAQGRWTVGVRPSDTAQILTNYDISEMGYNKLGSRFLLFSAGRYMLDKQIKINKTAGVTVLDHFPSQLNRFFMHAKEMGIVAKDLALRMIVGIGEPIAESRKTKLEQVFGVPIMSLWGMMESGTMAAECEARHGMHIFSHRVILEVIDPETRERLPEGEEGELVITPLLYETMPLIRYRTGDIARIFPYEPCSCGRTLPRMSMIRGIVSQAIHVKGKRILPLDMEEALSDLDELAGDYQIVTDEPRDISRLKVKLDYKDGIHDLERLKNRISEAIYKSLGAESEIELVPQGSIAGTSKALRFIKTYE